jgi:glutamate 5-kinase
MADHLQLRGAVTVDDGAVAKIVREGKSLLPIGMTGVEGDFSRGDVIAVRDPQGPRSRAGWPTTRPARRGCCAASRRPTSSACSATRPSPR